jgi:hypothetical protein
MKCPRCSPRSKGLSSSLESTRRSGPRYEKRGDSEQAARYYVLSLKQNPQNEFAKKSSPKWASRFHNYRSTSDVGYTPKIRRGYGGASQAVTKLEQDAQPASFTACWSNCDETGVRPRETEDLVLQL